MEQHQADQYLHYESHRRRGAESLLEEIMKTNPIWGKKQKQQASKPKKPRFHMR